MNEIKRILLVEDNKKDVELTLVVTVNDGAEALDYLFRRGQFATRPEELPAVILLDMKMPKVGGLAVLRQIKADPKLKQIPVVMLTSSLEEQDLVQSYDLGVSAYVVKPVSFQLFVDTVKQLGLFWAVINEPPPGTARKKT